MPEDTRKSGEELHEQIEAGCPALQNSLNDSSSVMVERSPIARDFRITHSAPIISEDHPAATGMHCAAN
ncbi:hypothetical protein GY45DRAFT_443111 [Cubamyces sp. BRFM 1775]|nr:hypothetical protein GY45DRAFT_443111 [Cubamyces sp. BRFM 1775]